MNIKELSKDISVSEQITLKDVQTIRDAGFKTIVCHRPNDEVGDYVHFDEVVALAKKLGLSSVHQPVISGKISNDDGQRFKNIMDSSAAPLFAYCRTGTRSTTLWALAKAKELSTAEILATSEAAGYDMSEVVKGIVEGASKVVK